MSWSHILAFVIGVSVTIGGYETNRMFAQPDARINAAQARANIAQQKKPNKTAAAAAAKKKAAAKRKKANANNGKKANASGAKKLPAANAADQEGRARRAEARAEAIAAPAEGEKQVTEEAKAEE